MAVSEDLFMRGLCLPSGTQLTENDLDRVVEVIKDCSNQQIKNEADWKKSAVKFNLIPGSLKTRAYLKRIFMGRLVPLPSEITEGMAPYDPPAEIPVDKVNTGYKILYAVGRR